MFDDLLQCGYQLGGTGPKYDCFTLCREVLKRMGVDIPAWESIADNCLRSEEIQNRKRDFIKLDSPIPGCIVTFKFRKKLVTHMGVVVGDFRFIHIMENRNVSIERLSVWKGNIDGYYQFTNNRKSL